MHISKQTLHNGQKFLEIKEIVVSPVQITQQAKKCCELWKSSGTQGWGSEGRGNGRALCGLYSVPRLCILFATVKEHTVLVFCNKQDIVQILFQRSIIKGFFVVVVLFLIEGNSKVQSTLCRCYRDTKVQDKVLPTTGRLF